MPPITVAQDIPDLGELLTLPAVLPIKPRLSEPLLLLQCGKKGTGDGEFSSPRGVWTCAGEIYVIDAVSCRVSVFTEEGCFVRNFGCPIESMGGATDELDSAWHAPSPDASAGSDDPSSQCMRACEHEPLAFSASFVTSVHNAAA